MKLSELPESERSSAISFVKEIETWYLAQVGETRDRILSYIFGLNAGGLVAAAAYISEKGANRLTVTAIVLFAAGLLAAVVRAAAGRGSLHSFSAIRGLDE